MHPMEISPALIASVHIDSAVIAYDALEQAGGFPHRTHVLRRLERIVARAVSAKRGVPKLPERVEYPSKSAAKAAAAASLEQAFSWDHDRAFPWRLVAETLEMFAQGYVEPPSAAPAQ